MEEEDGAELKTAFPTWLATVEDDEEEDKEQSSRGDGAGEIGREINVRNEVWIKRDIRECKKQ